MKTLNDLFNEVLERQKEEQPQTDKLDFFDTDLKYIGSFDAPIPYPEFWCLPVLQRGWSLEKQAYETIALPNRKFQLRKFSSVPFKGRILIRHTYEEVK